MHRRPTNSSQLPVSLLSTSSTYTATSPDEGRKAQALFAYAFDHTRFAASRDRNTDRNLDLDDLNLRDHLAAFPRRAPSATLPLRAAARRRSPDRGRQPRVQVGDTPSPVAKMDLHARSTLARHQVERIQKIPNRSGATTRSPCHILLHVRLVALFDHLIPSQQ
jgi:hypothetical protein